MKLAILTPEVQRQLKHIKASPGCDLSRFPDFLIIGPPRTATTWLQHHLNFHPRIFLPKEKETYYFTTLGNPSAPRYRFPTLEAFLADQQDTPRVWLKKAATSLVCSRALYAPEVRGEATASNATLPLEVIQEIARINPAVKAIMMVRHPVERAWSHAKKDLVLRTGRASHEVPAKEYDKFFRAAGQMENAFYSELIANWRGALQPGALALFDFNLVAARPRELVTSVLQFLGVSSEARYLDLARLEQRINRTTDEGVPPQVREILNVRLQDAIADYERVLKALAHG